MDEEWHVTKSYGVLHATNNVKRDVWDFCGLMDEAEYNKG